MVDASVVVKLFLPEDLSANAGELFKRGVDLQKRFFIPDFFYIECANIFWKYVRRLGLPPEEARKSLQDLRALSLLSVSTKDLLSASLDLALEFGTSAYDASYAVLAQELSFPLVTADQKLIPKLAGSGTDVIWLGDLPP